MSTIKINFWDKLFFGYYAYGKNFYHKSYSSGYAENLFFAANMFALVPVLVFIVLLICENIVCFSNCEDWSIAILIGHCYLLSTVYFNFKKRNRRIIEYFANANENEVKRMKKISGLYMLITAIWLFSSITIAFLYREYILDLIK